MKRLTQTEVEALPVGTKVFVKWSGGNGPHWYMIGENKWGNKTIETKFRGREDKTVLMCFVGSAFIGEKSPWTTVEIEDEDDTRETESPRTTPRPPAKGH